jgi:hypothetical protein
MDTLQDIKKKFDITKTHTCTLPFLEKKVLKQEEKIPEK